MSRLSLVSHPRWPTVTGALPVSGWGVPVCAGGQAFLYACCQPPTWAQTGSLPYKGRRGGADLTEFEKSASIPRTLRCLRERLYFFQQHCKDHTLQKEMPPFLKALFSFSDDSLWEGESPKQCMCAQNTLCPLPACVSDSSVPQLCFPLSLISQVNSIHALKTL